MIIVGVTGGIGSGKSTLCAKWEELGALVIYADDLAKKLMVTNEKVRRKISAAFGENSYNKDGSLNKTHLIEEAFNKNRVEELNKIVHPAVADAFRDICINAKENDEKIVVKEAALLLNIGRPEEFDYIVMVTIPENLQIERVMERDNVSKEEVLSRKKNQPDFEKLISYADYVIHNDGTKEELKKKATSLFKTLLKQDK